MSVQNSIISGEVFQIEVSAGLVHPLGVDKMQTCVHLGYLLGYNFLVFCNHFKTIPPMSVQSGTFVGEEFSN